MSGTAPGQSLLAGIAPAKPDENGLLVTLKGGEEKAIFDGRSLDVLYRLSTTRVWGIDAVMFEDGSFVVPSEVAHVRPTSRAELEKEPNPADPVERVEAAADRVEAAVAAHADDDVASWTDQEVRDALDALQNIPRNLGRPVTAEESVEVIRLASVLVSRGVVPPVQPPAPAAQTPAGPPIVVGSTGAEAGKP